LAGNASLPCPNPVYLGNDLDITVTLPTLQVGADYALNLSMSIEKAHRQGNAGVLDSHLALNYTPENVSAGCPLFLAFAA
jgi:hypothetical protein